MLKQNNTEGAILRWWQEETTPPALARSLPPVRAEVFAAPMDIGEELEAEARRRVAAEACGSRVTILPVNNKWKILQLRLSLFFLLPIGIVDLALTALTHDFWGVFLWLVTLGGITGFYESLIRKLKKLQTEPVVTLTDAGITIQTVLCDPGLIYWDEIQDIRAYSSHLNRNVGIQPRDIKGLEHRLGTGKARMLRINRFLFPGKYFINFAQGHFPIKADELVKQIAEFRTRNQV